MCIRVHMRTHKSSSALPTIDSRCREYCRARGEQGRGGARAHAGEGEDGSQRSGAARTGAGRQSAHGLPIAHCKGLIGAPRLFRARLPRPAAAPGVAASRPRAASSARRHSPRRRPPRSRPLASAWRTASATAACFSASPLSLWPTETQVFRARVRRAARRKPARRSACGSCRPPHTADAPNAARVRTRCAPPRTPLPWPSACSCHRSPSTF
jgi:hypothetical protein